MMNVACWDRSSGHRWWIVAGTLVSHRWFLLATDKISYLPSHLLEGSEGREGRGGGYNVFLHFLGILKSLQYICTRYMHLSCENFGWHFIWIMQGREIRTSDNKGQGHIKSKTWVKVICVLWKKLLKGYVFFCYLFKWFLRLRILCVNLNDF